MVECRVSNVHKSTHLTSLPLLLYYQLLHHSPAGLFMCGCLLWAFSLWNSNWFCKWSTDVISLKTLPCNFTLKCFYWHIKKKRCSSQSVLLDNWEWTRLISVGALREQAAVSRLISSGHKAAVLVFLAGGFTRWTLRDRSWWILTPCSWASLPLRKTSLTTTCSLACFPHIISVTSFFCLCFYLWHISPHRFCLGVHFHPAVKEMKCKLDGIFFFSYCQMKRIAYCQKTKHSCC